MIFNNFGFNAQQIAAAEAAVLPIISDSVIFWLDPANPASYGGYNIVTGSGTIPGITWKSVSGSSTAPFNIIKAQTTSTLTMTGSWFSTNGDLRFQTNTMVPRPPQSLWTIEAWVNIYSQNLGYGNIMTATFGGQTSMNYNLGNALSSGGNGARPAAQGINNGTTRVGSGPIPNTLIGQGWTHVVGTASTGSGGQYTVYLNGVQAVRQDNQGTINANTSTTAYTFINHDNNQNGGSFNASWGQMRFYSRPLTLAEIQQNYNATRGIYGR